MKYIDNGHSYINDDGVVYTSVTQMIKKYQPEKDWNEIATKYAKKTKQTVEEVQAAWKEEGRKAIEKGLSFHKEAEEVLVAAGEKEINGVKYKVTSSPMDDGIKIAIPLKLEDGVYPEPIIYSHKYQIAGQADYVEVVDGKINIIDYKTSKEIKQESYKHWKFGYEMMKSPVSHLMNCNYFQYALQINIYMLLLKQHNPKLKVGHMEILHVKDNPDPFSDDRIYVSYVVPNLQKEARAVLDHHLKTL